MSTVNLSFQLDGSAQAAVDTFLASLNKQIEAIDKVSHAIVNFNEKGEELSRTYKVIKASGEQIDVTLAKNGQAFDLLSAKVNSATASLKELEKQEKLVAQAKLRQDANAAEATLNPLINRPGQTTNQVNATQQALQRIKTLIDSGAVSLERFRQIFAALQANPKAIIPGLTAQEAQLSIALRNLIAGFDKLGNTAKESGEKISISWQGMLRLFEAQVIKRATSALESALLDSVKTAADFSVKIAEIETISQKAGLTTEEWTRGIRQLSEQFARPQTDVAEAAYQAISNQVTKGADAFTFLTSALKFGKATVTSAADSVNLLSSAIKAYNLPASDAERISSIFFKTIELGRVRASDLANTFGNVSTIAAEAGIKLEEVGAAIATITSRGVLPNTAQTLLTNVISKLIKPTEEMKKLFEEWGVASGQAAIATFGFAGVLQKLDLEAQKGGNRLAELFNQLRSLRGITGLTGNAFGDFQSNLEDITNASDEYDKATKKIEESFGERLKKQLNEAKVFFAEFGDTVITVLVRTFEMFGGFGNILRTTFNLLVPLGIATASYFAITVGGNAVLAGSVALFGAQNTALLLNAVGFTSVATAVQAKAAADAAAAQLALANANAVTAQTTAVQALQATLIPFAAVATITFALDRLFGITDKIFGVEAYNNMKRWREELEKVAQVRFVNFANVDEQSKIRKLETTDIRNAFQERFRLALLFNSQQLKLANDLRQRTIDNLKDSTDRLKVYSKSYFDGLRNQISTFRETANEARNLIKESLKVAEDIPRRATATIFENKIKFANEGRLDNATGLVVDDQKAELTRKRINDLTNLAREKFREGTKESVEEAIRRGSIAPTAIDVDPVTGQAKARYEFVAKTADFERQINSLAHERLALEQQFRQEQELREQQAEQAIAKEKERLRTIQQAFEAIEKISIFDKGGTVKKEVKEDPNRAINEFERQAKIIKDLTAGDDLQTQIQLFSELNKQRLALTQQVNAAILAENIKAENEEFQLKSRNIDNIIKRNEQLQQQAIGNIRAGFKEFEIQLGLLGKTGKAADFINQLKSNFEEFGKNTSPENFKKLDNTVKELERLSKLRGEFQSLEGIIGRFKTSIDQINFGLTQRATADKDLANIDLEGKKLGHTLSQIPGAFDLVAQAAAQASTGTQDNIQQVIDKVEQLVSSIDKARLQLNGLNAELPPIRGDRLFIPDAPGQMFGGLPKYMSAGGFVGFVPRGSDRYPAMLARNEVVMTEQATNSFLPILKAMNAGIMPKTGGNNSVTNVGDINVSVNGGSTSEATVRSIAKGLRRGIKRGTINLG